LWPRGNPGHDLGYPGHEREAVAGLPDTTEGELLRIATAPS
jgi:hypothetical protein